MAYEQSVEAETQGYAGANTARQFSQIPREQSPRMQNAYMDKVGDLSKRPGTVPVTTSALGAPIGYLTAYKSTPTQAASTDILGASGTTLYKYGSGTWTAQTMTNALNTSDIYTTPFVDATLSPALVIADGGSLKKLSGSTVANITPAADDTAPAPPNILASVNAKGPKFCWTYSGHVFVSDGSNEYWYTKRYTNDYIPSVQYELLVRDNDYINGCGVAFNNVCLIPMRKGWNILAGSLFDDFDSSRYLNTTAGCIAPRSIQRVTYPDGSQTIVYVSDDGVHEIFDTGYIDVGSRQYATRGLMKDKIDFVALGLTETEKRATVGFFMPEWSVYLLSFQKSGVNYTYAYDVRNREWYTDWLTISCKAFAALDGKLYFGGSTGHLHKFDSTLYTDWNQVAKTTGTAVNFKRYSPAVALEFSGYESYWDKYLVESKQWIVPATLDITFIFANQTTIMGQAIKNEIFIEGVSKWGQAKYVNVNFTDLVNEPNEISFEFSPKSKYVQVLWENNRDEPVKIYKEKWKGRVSGR